jgi:hypothetical protein
MTDTISLNTLLLEVMIYAKNEAFFIHDLSDHTLKIIFDAWWASMNGVSKGPIAWNNSRYRPSRRLYLDCGIAETASPGIIISIICYQVLQHPSENGTIYLGKLLLAKRILQS